MPKNYRKKINNIVNRSIKKELNINRSNTNSQQSNIDDILDLHGYKKVEAHLLVLDFIENAKKNNFKIIRIITGKGEDGYSPLKSYVIDIINELDLKYTFAPENEGGHGAIDISIKK